MSNIALSQSEKLTLFSNLAVMIAAGIPILEAVQSLAEDAKGPSRRFLINLESDIKQGQSLSSTFAKFKKSFDPVIVGLIQAGEKSGTLETTFFNLEKAVKKEIEFSSKIKSALAYPLLVIVFFCLVLIGILIFVIPRIAQVFSRLNLQLPLPTKVLILISNSLIEFAPIVIVSFILIILILYLLFQFKRELFFNLLFLIPLVSNLGKFIDLSRFSNSFSLLISSGIPIDDALELSSHVIVDRRINTIIRKSREAVMSGEKLSVCMKRYGSKTIPGLVIRLIDAGERSGSLDKSMAMIDEYYNNQVSTNLKVISELLEPLLLIIVGVVIGGTLLAIVAPIYQLIGQLRGH